jgi:membrane protein YdbS with pleckstrin-like domain
MMRRATTTAVAAALLCTSALLTADAQAAALTTCANLPANAQGGIGVYQFCYDLNRATNVLTATVAVAPLEPGGWVGFGFNPDPARMNGGSVILGYTDGASTNVISNYETAGYDIMHVGTGALNLTSMSVSIDTTQGVRTMLSWTMPINPMYITAASTANIIFSHGPKPGSDNIPAQHQRGSAGNFLGFNFLTGGISIDNTQMQYRAAHGIMMCFAWGLFIPLGIMSSRYFKGYTPAWFVTHQVLILTGLTVAFVAWIIGLVRIADGQHPTHRALGIATMVIALSNPFIALVRPAATLKGEEPTLIRRVWEVVHHSVGRIAYVLAIINVFFGLSYYNTTPGMINRNTIIFLVLWLCVMALAVALEVRHRAYPDQRPFESLFPVQNDEHVTQAKQANPIPQPAPSVEIA